MDLGNSFLSGAYLHAELLGYKELQCIDLTTCTFQVSLHRGILFRNEIVQLFYSMEHFNKFMKIWAVRFFLFMSSSVFYYCFSVLHVFQFLPQSHHDPLARPLSEFHFFVNRKPLKF